MSKKLLILYHPPPKCESSKEHTQCAFYNDEYSTCSLFHQPMVFIKDVPYDEKRGSMERPDTWTETFYRDGNGFQHSRFHCGLTEIEIHGQ